MKNINNKSEIRKNILTGDWVIIAPSRGLRLQKPLGHCPFCVLDEQEIPILIINKGKVVNSIDKWTTIVIPNKFPVLNPKIEPKENMDDYCRSISSPGHHELVISKDHDRSIAEMKTWEIKEIIDCYHQRISVLRNEKAVSYVFVFQNHGPMAGASQKHPHSQIITLPFVDHELEGIINSSRAYFRKNNRCLHCDLIKNEIKEKARIVFENESFIAYIPFAPKFLFQIILTPKKHQSHFEDISEDDRALLAEAFKVILKKYTKKLNNPSYNFYLHNSPCDNKDYGFFHWYFAFMPRMTNLAGFEISANMEIISMYPEEQVKYLK